MKRTYQLKLEGKNRDRLLDAAKHDIRKYAKRERARILPAGVDFWDFVCRCGRNEATSTLVHFAALMAAVDALVGEGAEQFYVEVVTHPGHRISRPRDESASATPT